MIFVQKHSQLSIDLSFPIGNDRYNAKSKTIIDL